MKKSVYLSPSTQKNNLGYGNYGTEADRMNQVGDVTEKILKKHGLTIYRNKKTWSLTQVVADSNRLSPGIHVAIHSNAGGGRGPEIFAYAPGGEGEKVARKIYEQIMLIAPMAGRGVKFNKDLYELRVTKAPAALLEIAFHDHPLDAKWIMENIGEIGQSIAYGIIRYFGLNTLKPEKSSVSGESLNSEKSDLEKAIKILVQNKIIQTPEYWLENALSGKAIKGEYAAQLALRIAKQLKLK